MKSLYAFSFGIALSCVSMTAANAQNITFPDQSFKDMLITLGHDTNNDGQISKAEAAKVKKLYVDKAGITSLVGIKNFVNLEDFGFYENQVKHLDLEGMTNLKWIYGWKNELLSLKVKGCTNLEGIYVSQNKLRVLDLTGINKLQEIEIWQNNFEAIDLSNKPELKEVNGAWNKIFEFKAIGSPNIKTIKMESNYVSEIDLKPFGKLEWVDFSDNPLKKVDVRGLLYLKTLYLQGRKFPNYLTQLNTTALISLETYDW